MAYLNKPVLQRRSVDESADKRFGFTWPTFTLKKAAWYFTGGIGAFLIVDGQWKEVLTRLGFFFTNSRYQYHGIANTYFDGRGSLTCNLPCLHGDLLAAKLKFFDYWIHLNSLGYDPHRILLADGFEYLALGVTGSRRALAAQA